MDEATIRTAINTSYWVSAGCGLLLIVNGALMIYLATKVSTLSRGIEKFFHWFDNRQCGKHKVYIRRLIQEINEIKAEVAELKRNSNG